MDATFWLKEMSQNSIHFVFNPTHPTLIADLRWRCPHRLRAPATQASTQLLTGLSGVTRHHPTWATRERVIPVEQVPAWGDQVAWSRS